MPSAPSAGPFASSPPSPRTLSDLDERLAAGTPGILIARAQDRVVDALLAHAARRGQGGGRIAIVARAHAGAPLWQEVASRLGVPRIPCNPSRCAEQIAGAALVRRALVVARLPHPGSWDHAVAVELSSLASPPFVLFVADERDDAGDVAGARFDVTTTLDDGEKRCWWSAIADEAHALVASDDLARLESWWAAAKRASVAQPDGDEEEVPVAGRTLFGALALAGRPWPVAEIAALEPLAEGALDSLFAVGAIQLAAGWVATAASWEGRCARAIASATAPSRERVANALLSGPGSEPWAFARAAELLAHGTADEKTIEAADRAHAMALATAEDPLARREIVARWMTAVEALAGAQRRELLIRTAERALSAGEPDEATRCLAVAGSLGSEDVRALTLLGRATAALGDLVAGRVALDRARGLAKASVAEGAIELGARVAVEQAEVAYMIGDLPSARQYAEEALAAATEGATRLKARNTLGKLLLAESKWDAADVHFAEDGMAAAALKDTSGGLRARLNRGIALLSKGLSDEARALFESVLAEGERTGESRASAYALSNLGHLASQRHEYGAALQHWERAIKLLHAIGDRVSAARMLTNLASLRHMIGLLDHAEHALSFGRRTFGRAITAGRASNFDIVAARIDLTRGRTADARREIEAAIVKATGDLDLLGRAHRLAARIALEDGDLPRVAQAIASARELATNDEARAEIALLEALYERAAGNEDPEPAKAALALAKTSGEEQLLREVHVLLVELHRSAGNTKAARAHLEQAVLLRDKVAARIPSELRDTYLARPDIALLARLQPLVAEPVAEAAAAEDMAPRSAPSLRPAASSAREIVGDDPAIRGLLLAIRKVARSTSTVLIRGESGTGKELVAEALHRASERSGGPLVTVNCAALVETLLLSELFGHEKGAFTGAFARRRGRFELAEGGTLFLDEIGDISPRTQVALLRVLQERTFERVGGTTAIRANVRIVCATHRDLRGMVERGEFREDLYYRLRGITLEVPALRARSGDIPRISEHLLARIASERGEARKTLAPDAIELLGRHRWPGNVRELENALRVASLFAETNEIAASDLLDNVDDLRPLAGSQASQGGAARPARSGEVPVAARETLASVVHEGDSGTTLSDTDTDGGESDAPLPPIEANATSVAYAQVRHGVVSLSDMKRQIERDCIARALAETKGNITRAAAILGMKRPRLSQLVKQYGLAAVSSEGSG
jgi:transcriptional regulator with GAF, ATPase, and Fis domain/tetratricopeptide (TPR) repeat protein